MMNVFMLLLVLFVTQAWAQSLDSFMMPPKTQLTLSARSALEQYGAQAQIVAVKNEEQTLVFGFRYSMLDAYPIKKDLFIEDVTASYTKNLEGRRKMGSRLMVGSQSDKPFANARVLAIFASLYYMYPTSEQSQWMLSINYSNTISFWNGIPFPGVNYFYRSPKWIVLAGFPLNSVTWMSEHGYTLSATLLGYGFRLEALHGPPQGLQPFVSVEWGQQGFLLKDRARTKDRFFYDEKKASLGVRGPINEKLKFDLRGGYAFDRSFFTGENYSDKKASNTFEIADSWYGAVSLTQDF